MLVGGAFGAGLIQLGAPAKLPFSLYGNAHEGSGGARPWHGAHAADRRTRPRRRPRLGHARAQHHRGEGCLQLGRIVDGKLGALGQDGAFANDGRFHELPVSAAFAVNSCALLDGKGRLFTNVTADERAASAWIGVGGRLGGCVPPSAGPYEKGLRLTRQEREHGAKPATICAQGDLRNIYYGLLGPEAQSITYVLDGQRHTLPTVGADGAYMFVTLASAHQLLNFANAGTADIVPVDGPIKEIHYRDGSTCHLTSKSWIGGSYACTPSLSEPVGYVQVGKAPSAAAVATPIHTRLTRGRHGRYVITISFTARTPVTDARRVYGINWREPGMAPGAYGGMSTNSNIAAGQTITRTIGEYGPTLRAGLVRGSVTLRQALGPGGIEGPGSVAVPVGSFAVRVP